MLRTLIRVVGAAMLLSFASCGGTSANPAYIGQQLVENGDEQSEKDQQIAGAFLKLSTIQLEELSSNRDQIRVRVRAEFKAKREITRARVRIRVKDSAGTELGSEEHWIGAISDRGLQPGQSILEEFIVAVSNRAASMTAEIQPLIVRGPGIPRHAVRE